MVLYTAQHEAAVHEAAHVWYTLNQDDALTDAMVNMMLSQSDRVALPHWQPFRRLMNVYRYGQGDWPGMWVQSANRWNHDEIWAGGASFSMGVLRQYPVMARRLYERMFEPANWTLLPLVMR